MYSRAWPEETMEPLFRFRTWKETASITASNAGRMMRIRTAPMAAFLFVIGRYQTESGRLACSRRGVSPGGGSSRMNLKNEDGGAVFCLTVTFAFVPTVGRDARREQAKTPALQGGIDYLGVRAREWPVLQSGGNWIADDIVDRAFQLLRITDATVEAFSLP